MFKARLMMKKSYLPIKYEVAVDDKEYYVTFSGINEGSRENIYKVVNGMCPVLAANNSGIESV